MRYFQGGSENSKHLELTTWIIPPSGQDHSSSKNVMQQTCNPPGEGRNVQDIPRTIPEFQCLDHVPLGDGPLPYSYSIKVTNLSSECTSFLWEGGLGLSHNLSYAPISNCSLLVKQYVCLIPCIPVLSSSVYNIF